MNQASFRQRVMGGQTWRWQERRGPHGDWPEGDWPEGDWGRVLGSSLHRRATVETGAGPRPDAVAGINRHGVATRRRKGIGTGHGRGG